MGTSADYGGPKGGEWTKYKRAAANYARYGQQRQRRKLLSSYASAVASGGGGAAGGGAGGRIGGGIVSAGPGIASFAADVARDGLDQALENRGLRDVIGRDRFEVFSAIIDALTGDGSTLDEQHAKTALIEAMPVLFPDDAQDYEELADTPVDEAKVRAFLELWSAEVVISEMALVLDRHLQKCATHAEREQRENDLRDDIQSLVKLEVGDRDLVDVDWGGQEGRQIFDSVAENMQQLMVAEEEE